MASQPQLAGAPPQPLAQPVGEAYAQPTPQAQSETSQARFTTCPRCNSPRVVPAVTIAMVGEGLGALAVEGGRPTVLRATVCGDCGHADTYVDNALQLYESYQKQSGS